MGLTIVTSPLVSVLTSKILSSFALVFKCVPMAIVPHCRAGQPASSKIGWSATVSQPHLISPGIGHLRGVMHLKLLKRGSVLQLILAF